MKITDESIIPSFKPGSLVAISNMPFPHLINWSEYYYIIDINGQGRIRRVYAGETENGISLVTDHPEQDKYPPIFIKWNDIKAIYKVRAEIIKH